MIKKWSESVRTSSRGTKIKYLASLQFSCGTLFLQSRERKTKRCDAEKPNTETATVEEKKKQKQPSSFSLLHSRDGGHLVRAVSARLQRTTEVNRNMSSVHVLESKHLSRPPSHFHPLSFLLSPFKCFSLCKPRPLSRSVRAGVKGL